MKKQSKKTFTKVSKRIHTQQELLKTALGALEESAGRFEYCKFYVNQRGVETAIDALSEVQTSLDEM